MWYSPLIEKNLVPDFLIRQGIRSLLKQRLQDETEPDEHLQKIRKLRLIEELKNSPLAIHTREANEQHYELPTEFFSYCLGSHMKYSSGYWKTAADTLNDSERHMLELSCERAGLRDGQRVLELGCGWGSLSLFMAVTYPGSEFTVVSNSSTQKQYIDEKAKERKLCNLKVITCDMNELELQGTFDRVLSVEMFEHLRNYRLLFERIAAWLKEDGKMFVHVFTHKTLAYKFEVKDESDWMSRYFFTGGIMPSNDLFSHFDEHLRISQTWTVNGMHYSRTAEAWLSNMDRHRKQIFPVLESTYGKDQALKWWVYWRIFYMACAELWAYRNGEEWMVCHYLFEKR